MPSLFVFALLTLAVYRATVMINRDIIFEWLRDAYRRRFPDDDTYYKAKYIRIDEDDVKAGKAHVWPFKIPVKRRTTDDGHLWVPTKPRDSDRNFIECFFCVSVWFTIALTTAWSLITDASLSASLLTGAGIAGAAELVNNRLGRD